MSCSGDEVRAAAIHEGSFRIESNGLEKTLVLPSELPAGTLLVMIRDRRCLVMSASSREVNENSSGGKTTATARITNLSWKATGGQTEFGPTYGMLVAADGDGPGKEGLEAILPDLLLTSDATEQELSVELDRLADEIRAQYPDCTVRVERFSGS